jgi:hypothetical protein
VSKIPIDAFELYVGMGTERSYEEVARHYNVNKRSVTRAAHRERWSERLTMIQRAAQARVDEKLIGDIEEMKLRHRKLLRAMASRAAQAIATHALEDGMQGIRAAEITVKLERLMMGEPSDRSEAVIIDVTRQEIRELLEPVDADQDDDESDADADGAEDAEGGGLLEQAPA